MSQRESSVQWAVAFDDGEVQQMRDRQAAEDYIASIQEDIAEGHYDPEDYAGMRLVRRTQVVITTTWTCPTSPGIGDAS